MATLQLKNITENLKKKALDDFNNNWGDTRISKLENTSIEIIQSEEQKENKDKWTESCKIASS